MELRILPADSVQLDFYRREFRFGGSELSDSLVARELLLTRGSSGWRTGGGRVGEADEFRCRVAQSSFERYRAGECRYTSGEYFVFLGMQSQSSVVRGRRSRGRRTFLISAISSHCNIPYSFASTTACPLNNSTMRLSLSSNPVVNVEFGPKFDVE